MFWIVSAVIVAVLVGAAVSDLHAGASGKALAALVLVLLVLSALALRVLALRRVTTAQQRSVVLAGHAPDAFGIRATLMFRREPTANSQDAGRAYRIRVNQRQVCQLRYGQGLRRELAPGTSRVQARVDWTGSRRKRSRSAPARSPRL